MRQFASLFLLLLILGGIGYHTLSTLEQRYSEEDRV